MTSDLLMDSCIRSEAPAFKLRSVQGVHTISTNVVFRVPPSRPLLQQSQVLSFRRQSQLPSSWLHSYLCDGDIETSTHQGLTFEHSIASQSLLPSTEHH